MASHKEWRKIAKKERRRRIRKEKAQERCAKEKYEEQKRNADVNYQQWSLQQQRLEDFKATEADRLRQQQNAQWLEREKVAQHQWRLLQCKISKAKHERAQQDIRIRKEWEEEQKKLEAALEARKRQEEEKLHQHQDLTKRIEEFASGLGDLPAELRDVCETNPEKEVCPFYSKIGVCRFGDGCSRNHRKPSASKVLLAKNFYSNFGIEHSGPNEYDTDILLEYDDRETYKHFEEFFDDVLPEFQQFGRILQFKVCCNFERHLRGNTYIEYESLRDAVKVYRSFHGRWYGGKQISLQFCDIPSWKQATCGLFASKRCPKGKSCNFLHVFQNPGNLFTDNYSRKQEKSDYSKRSSRSSRSWSKNKENGRNWRWSESPEPKKRNSSCTKTSSPDKSYKHKKSTRLNEKDHKRVIKRDYSNRSKRCRNKSK